MAESINFIYQITVLEIFAQVGNLSEGVTVRFDPVTSNKLRVEAHQKGIGPTTLIRMWVMERLGGQTIMPARA